MTGYMLVGALLAGAAFLMFVVFCGLVISGRLARMEQNAAEAELAAVVQIKEAETRRRVANVLHDEEIRRIIDSTPRDPAA